MSFDKDSDTYLEIRDKIANFAFPPGSRLNIADIADSMHASQTPIRECLVRLAAEDYIDSVHARGFFVKPPNESYYIGHLRVLIFLMIGAAITLAATTKKGKLGDLADMARSHSKITANSTLNIAQLQTIFNTLFEGANANNHVAAKLIHGIIEKLRFVLAQDSQDGSDTNEILAGITDFVNELATRTEEEWQLSVKRIAVGSEIALQNRMKAAILNLHYKFSQTLGRIARPAVWK